MIEVYTDGSCRPNGSGGWACHARLPNSFVLFEASDHIKETTNNRMEMTALLEGLKWIRRHISANAGKENMAPYAQYIVYSDSQYALKGLTEWLKGWKARGWKTANKGQVANIDLWQLLDEEYRLVCQDQIKVKFEWVKGHSGNPGNSRVDQMAQAQSAKGYPGK